MLTVKHIIWGGGFETLYQAKQVRVKRFDSPADVKLPTNPEFIAFDLPNDEVHTLKFGLVYVMNEMGKTVAKYDFGPAPDSKQPLPPSSATWTASTASDNVRVG